VDHPFPEQLSRIGAARDSPLQWERHYIPGSSIRDRSDIPVPEGVYDASLITEQHGLISSMVWSDTVRQLRAWHDRMIAKNPEAVTFFYVPWLSIDDKNDPRRWIAYERAASHVWQCIVTRINMDLAQQGRKDRIATIPANLALAYLVERLQAGELIPNAAQPSFRVSVDSLIRDNVHLTELGSFYVALISYASMTGDSLEDVPGSPQERFLADVASRFLTDRTKDRRAMTATNCHRYIQETFHADYWEYAWRPCAGWQHPAEFGGTLSHGERCETPLLMLK
jgi:hypothetical protein